MRSVVHLPTELPTGLPQFHAEPLAEDALLLRFGDTIDSAINAEVQRVTHCLRLALPQVECIPAYASILLRFDPQQWRDLAGPHALVLVAAQAALAQGTEPASAARECVIPVCYGDVLGPDLAAVAACCGLDSGQVIALHAAGDYRVAMIGFAPGFPYLLGLDPRLVVPRRADPRQQVPAGSVAIGGAQTGIYPDCLPGGWHLIGRTPLRLFDLAAQPPSLLAAGDRVRFRAIGIDEFRELSA
jgi:KipI family sensor histidine kinase inhibitor